MREGLRSRLGYDARKQLRAEVQLVLDLLSKRNVYFRMPKVASGSITKAVSEDTTVLPHHYRPGRIRTLLKLRGSSFKFTFVRHPFTRFSSAYKWIAQRPTDISMNEFDTRQLEVVKRAGDVNAFCQLLPGLLTQKDLFLIHFYPQSDYVCSSEKLLVDFVGKYESFPESCQLIHERHGYELNVAFGPNAKNKKKRKLDQPVQSLLNLGVSESSIDILRSVYARDFDFFSYDMRDQG